MYCKYTRLWKNSDSIPVYVLKIARDELILLNFSSTVFWDVQLNDTMEFFNKDVMISKIMWDDSKQSAYQQLMYKK